MVIALPMQAFMSAVLLPWATLITNVCLWPGLQTADGPVVEMIAADDDDDSACTDSGMGEWLLAELLRLVDSRNAGSQRLFPFARV